MINDGRLHQILLGVFGLISAMLVAVALKIKSGLSTAAGSNDNSLEQIQQKLISKSILLFAMAEVPAILGLVLFLLTGRFPYLVGLCVISVFAFMMLKPSESSFNS